ncbi:MAG: primosomal protein N' [Bdellovibrionota bacterium]
MSCTTEFTDKRPYTLSVAIPRPVDHLFTYRLPDHLAPRVRIGGWVRVPFGRATTHAFVVEPPKTLDVESSLVLKDVMEAGDDESFIPEDVMSLCRWASTYYCISLGEMLGCAIPPASLGLKNFKHVARPIPTKDFAEQKNIKLTEEQAAACDALEKIRCDGSVNPKVAVLHGITGSGKTEVYLELARSTLKAGKSVIILVPEIALTPQLRTRFETGLRVQAAPWHSALPDGLRRDLGVALRTGEFKLVIGARSAVFAPVKDLGLIVVDEEHDSSYKQEDRVRYNARDLAIVRAKLTGALAILGSATPSMETLERVREGRYSTARLQNRISTSGLPSVELIDLCMEEKDERFRATFAKRTIQAICETIDSGEQVMLFLNRRGFASFLICHDCGDVKGCPNCSVSLTVHTRGKILRCHICGHWEYSSDVCRRCNGLHMKNVGAGTESLEEELPKLIPGMIPLRLDRDKASSAKKIESLLDKFRSGSANTLLGTQMLTKGHDFPGVTLVVVVLADALFRWPDFRASERAYQILKQVSGRAGRGEKPGRVLIQAFDTDHPVLEAIAGNLGEGIFLEQERSLRSALGYPPFGRLARIRVENNSMEKARTIIDTISKHLCKFVEKPKLELLGPSEAFIERAKGVYRWDLLLKARDITGLQPALEIARRASLQNKWRMFIDVDPYGTG